MALEEKNWLQKDADRLLTYQHQHRGLSFLKLRLPPTADRKVNLVGLDNHIYRGSIPKLPEDKLPANVDEQSIDEEALYKEIRDMKFPPVPPQEPLGTRRRIGGSYTLTKRMTLAPVKIDTGESLEEIPILGKDGGIYKGMAKHASKLELERQIRGTKRSIQIARQQGSSRGFIEPSLITLQDGQSKPFGRREKLFVELPAANVGTIIELILSQNRKTRRKDETIRDKTEPQLTKEKDDSHFEQTKEPIELEEDKSDYTESREESEDTESKEESEDLETMEETEAIEPIEESEETESKEESEDLETMEETEAIEPIEESEETESKKESEDLETKEEPEAIEPIEDSEV